MNEYFAVIFISAALFLSVVALVRERRLRRALQRILQRLFVHLRRSNVKEGRGGTGRHDDHDPDRLRAE